MARIIIIYVLVAILQRVSYGLQDTLEAEVENVFKTAPFHMQVDLLKPSLSNAKELNLRASKSNDPQPDACKKLEGDVKIAETVTQNAYNLFDKIAANVTTTWKETVNCTHVQIFKMIPCYLRNIFEIRNIIVEYKTKLVETEHAVSSSLTVLFTDIKNCIHKL